MMKITGGFTSCCIALFLALTSVSAVQRLKSINALKKINFGQSVPKHSLLLLHWFANTVDIDNNNIIWLTFDPESGDYGSHHYGNYEGLLNPLPWGYRYYTIGNLYQETSTELPSYVLRPQSLEYVGSNMDRIIIRVREQSIGRRALQRIDQVYITQHYDTSEYQGTPYDPDHTYQISTNLLRQIREFSVGQNQQTLSNLRNRFGSNADDFYIRNTWGHLACLGLFLFIVIQEKKSSNQHNNRLGNKQNHWGHNATETRKEIRGSNVSRYSQNQSETVVPIQDNDNHKTRKTYKKYIACFCFIFIILILIIFLSFI